MILCSKKYMTVIKEKKSLIAVQYSQPLQELRKYANMYLWLVMKNNSDRWL